MMVGRLVKQAAGGVKVVVNGAENVYVQEEAAVACGTGAGVAAAYAAGVAAAYGAIVVLFEHRPRSHKGRSDGDRRTPFSIQTRRP